MNTDTLSLQLRNGELACSDQPPACPRAEKLQRQRLGGIYLKMAPNTRPGGKFAETRQNIQAADMKPTMLARPGGNIRCGQLPNALFIRRQAL